MKKRMPLADLIVANNVLAHVPDLNSFVEGMHILLADNGIITVEFPYLLNLMKYNQFDTIYHEHFSYFSLQTVNRVFSAHGLKVFNVEQLPTHGGSLRVYACHQNNTGLQTAERMQTVTAMLQKEERIGVCGVELYRQFERQVRETKRNILAFLIDLKNQGKTIAGYGAPAKGNTLLNYCGVGTDFIDYTVDLNPNKQGTFLPGSRIPVYEPGHIKETKPDFLIILPWNLSDEIMQQCDFIKAWGGKFVTLIPQVKVI